MRTKKNKIITENRRSFITNPSKKKLILFTFLWLLGIILVMLSTTNLFTESFFQRKYIMIYFLIIGSTITIGMLYINYLKNKRRNSYSNDE